MRVTRSSWCGLVAALVLGLHGSVLAQEFGLASRPIWHPSHSLSGEAPPVEDDPELAEALERWWAKKKTDILGGDFDLTFGAAIRVRAERRDPANYVLANSRNAEDVTLLRTKVHFGLSVNEHLGGRIEFRDSRAFGDETPNSILSDSEGVDLHQGYFSLTNVQELAGIHTPDGMTTRIRAGRIRFPSLGDQRMFSAIDWSNIGRTFDGFELGVEAEKIDTHVYIATINEDPGLRAGRDAHLYIIYIETRPVPGFEFDLYAARRNYKTDSVTGENGLVGDLEDQTYGVRAVQRVGGLRVALEGAIQRGKSADDDVAAHGWAIEAGYHAKEVPYEPGITVGWTYGSGDGDPTDGDENTFRPIAPFAHAYQGHYDLFSWQNTHDYYVKTQVRCCDPFTLHVDLHHFVLDQEEDAWYSANGSVFRQDTTGRSGRTVGQELDIYLKGTVSERLNIWTGWSHLWRGRYVKKTGGGDTGNFVFFQAELLFGSKS